jgi:hypothetical protein
MDYTVLNKHSQQTLPEGSLHAPTHRPSYSLYDWCILLSFLDCYSGYHQIARKEEDQIKTAYITSFRAYAYTTISFRLKYAGATYQWAIQLTLLINYIAMLKPIWTRWSSRPEPTTSLSLISRKPSTAYASFGRSSTQPSAFSAYHK